MEYWNKCKFEDGQFKPLVLTDEQTQVLLTGKFGDGCFIYTNRSVFFSANCIYKDYIDFKASLLGDLCNRKDKVVNRGYKEGLVYRVYTSADPRIAFICDESLEDSFNRMNELGLALWVYDDGSLHKEKEFYQINTQKYPREVIEDLFIPALKRKFGITAKSTIERRRDGREFWYLRISKYEGSDIISSALDKYPVSCFTYKRWKPETTQKWNKLVKESKESGIDLSLLSTKTLSSMFRKISL